MRAALIAMAVASVLAGCADDAPSSDEAGNHAGQDSRSPAAPPASGPGADAPTQAATPQVRETPLHIEGSTAAGGCAVVQCHYEMTDSAFHLLDPPGPGVRLTGTLTWDAVSPTSQQLTLYVPTVVDGEYHWEAGYPSATGPSPLAFDLDLTVLGEAALGLIVGNGVAAGVPGGVVALQTPQEFLLDAVYRTDA